jgi:hypothetical protein
MHVIQRDVSEPALDLTDVGDVKVNGFGELLLRQFAFLAQPAHGRSKANQSKLPLACRYIVCVMSAP